MINFEIDEKPIAYVFWGDGVEDEFKTVCYTEEELQEELTLKYGKLKPSVVYANNKIGECKQ